MRIAMHIATDLLRIASELHTTRAILLTNKNGNKKGGHRFCDRQRGGCDFASSLPQAAGRAEDAILHPPCPQAAGKAEDALLNPPCP